MSDISAGVEYGLHCMLYLERISVLNVVVAIDGRKSLFECSDIRAGCAVFGRKAPRWATTGVCSIHAIMLEAERRMREVLAEHSLSDLAGRVAAKAPTKYGDEITSWFEERAAIRRRAGSTNSPPCDG